MSPSRTPGGDDPQDGALGLEAARGATGEVHDGAVGAVPDGPSNGENVEGERGIPSVNRVRSMQSRVTAVLAVGCLSVIATGLLAWYYTQALTRQHRAREVAHSHSTERAKSELILPPLPKEGSNEPSGKYRTSARAGFCSAVVTSPLATILPCESRARWCR